MYHKEKDKEPEMTTFSIQMRCNHTEDHEARFESQAAAIGYEQDCQNCKEAQAATPAKEIATITLKKSWVLKLYREEGKLLVCDMQGEILAETPRAILFRGAGLAGARITCLRCGRPLSHPTSRQCNIGPDCCEMLGIPWQQVEDPTAFEQALQERTYVGASTVNGREYPGTWFPKSKITIVSRELVASETREQAQTTQEEASPILDPMPTTASPYRVSYADHKLLITVPYVDRFLVRELPLRASWNGVAKVWEVPATVNTLRAIERIFQGVTLECLSDRGYGASRLK
jgi:hypothetical protein